MALDDWYTKWYEEQPINTRRHFARPPEWPDQLHTERRMDDYYSLNQLRKDGPITAPRWMHHLIKIMSSLSVLVGLLAARRSLHLSIVACGILSSVGLWSLITLKERLWPSDPAKYTLQQHLNDWVTDLSLASVSLVMSLLIAGVWSWRSTVLVVVMIVGYWQCHREARP